MKQYLIVSNKYTPNKFVGFEDHYGGLYVGDLPGINPKYYGDIMFPTKNKTFIKYAGLRNNNYGSIIVSGEMYLVHLFQISAVINVPDEIEDVENYFHAIHTLSNG